MTTALSSDCNSDTQVKVTGEIDVKLVVHVRKIRLTLPSDVEEK